MQILLPFNDLNKPAQQTCKKCGQLKPLTSFYPAKNKKNGYTGKCQECISQDRQAYYAKNSEHIKARGVAYRQTNPERLKKSQQSRRERVKTDPGLLEERREYFREYYRTHTEAYKQYRERYFTKNALNVAARQREQARAKYAADPERHRGYQKAYRERNHAIVTEKMRHRLARRRTIKGVYSDEEWKSLCAACGNVCLSCGRQSRLTVDHIIPVSMGGTSFGICNRFADVAIR